MTRRPGKKLSARAVRELLERMAYRLDAEMSRELMCRVYVFEDGSAALVDHDGRGVLWYSHQEMVSGYWASVRQARERKDLSVNLLLDAERFQTQFPKLVAELPELLDIERDLLNFSEESLDAVDSAIRKIGSERILTPEVFPSLTAYVGEVIRRQVNGSWEVRTTHEGTRHEPDIVDPTGGRYAVLRIYKELLEYGRKASMRAFVHAALRTHRLLPRH